MGYILGLTKLDNIRGFPIKKEKRKKSIMWGSYLFIFPFKD